ncbi:enoyl-CoA hydratase/isomerase family protein [Novosphingobium sp. MMS21-SN21R]|uniref:enoyl-CoA hydratase/isomerase family protein n=1 Tax=Novosphingobium sp. MMS21-SN21R TaxID=2969298 RepID=UPI0028849241|nr:enoyl-CoA hydratase/isomerase family protein [Novosphingobium sp. MMS21-SN21R]MDT0507018.1 enoyl-CoA hydratase/isomerase family protein [Novosphingobium sp. MMS21-SN21R]
MNFQTLTLRQTGAVLEITILNPPINLMSGKMVEELFQLTGYLIGNKDIRVVVLDSADPDFFVAHFDLEDLEASASDPAKASRYADINVLQSLGLAWQNLPQIKIAKVDGRCRGGGFEFILALDMRFASRKSLFCFPESSAGFLASGGGATRTALAAGPARALEVLLSARDFSADEAERYGLINRAVDDGDLDAYVSDLAGRIAARSLQVIAMHREVLGRAFSPVVEPLFAALAAENDGLRAGLASNEMKAAVAGHLKLGQTREVELDLPATMSALTAKN